MCRVCGFPFVWSLDRNREWCCVYGSHTVQPSALMLAADAELHADDRSVLTRFKRKGRDNA